MRIVFLGTPDFALPSLRALIASHEVVAVVCQPDREKDRKGNYVFGAVKKEAIAQGIPVYQFEKIRRDGVQTLKDLKPDLMVTCAYGQILSQEILDVAPFGVLNVHGSILPAYRGSAPIQRALINGEKKTGVTIMKTDVGMDSGDILAIEEYEIKPSDYVDDLYLVLSEIGAKLLIPTIDGYVSGKIAPVKQDESLVTHAPMIKKDDYLIDFSRPNTEIRNYIRGCGFGVCDLNGVQLKVYKADIVDDNENKSAGEIVRAKKREFIIACGEGALNLTELQLSGKKKMSTIDFLNGVKLTGEEKLTEIKQ
jgi:methionyl-tRNA formyltransferase